MHIYIYSKYTIYIIVYLNLTFLQNDKNDGKVRNEEIVTTLQRVQNQICHPVD